MWSCQGNMRKYYLRLRDILPEPNCPDNMPKYYSTKYHYRNLHEV